jgi:hypothetical protein
MHLIKSLFAFRGDIPIIDTSKQEMETEINERRIDRLYELRTGHPIGDVLERRLTEEEYSRRLRKNSTRCI